MKETESSLAGGPEHALTCPLLALQPKTLDDSVRRLVATSQPDDCTREKCAWWDSESSRCALVTLSLAVKSLAANQPAGVSE